MELLAANYVFVDSLALMWRVHMLLRRVLSVVSFAVLVLVEESRLVHTR